MRRSAGVLALVAAAVGTAAAAGMPAHGIATPHPRATEAGREILSAGGNAFGAAVAISAVLHVVEPHGSGLGGGGFWLLHQADSGRRVMVDGRERAPRAVRQEQFLAADGTLDRELALDHPLAAGIPGSPAALTHIAAQYAQLPRARLLAPAIRAAREGFRVDERYRRLAEFRAEVLRGWDTAAEVFLADGEVPPLGHVIRQPALARTLERIARHGRSAFYDGVVAERLVGAVNAHGGVWSRRDLRRYRVVEREPIVAERDGLRIVSAPPPSSGGIALAQMLHMLAGPGPTAGDGAAARVHRRVEAMRRAYHDRARHLGDTDFVDVPIARLTDPRYNAGLAATIHPRRATASAALPGPAGAAPASGGRNTTHFSVIDADGNRVAATLSLNYPFGSGFMPAGTGVVLNDHMDDFTLRPGEPNAYGLIQSRANRIEPGKRMLSSMSPSFVEQGERVAVLGTPGGSRIITTVLLAALEFADGAGPERMVSAPRYHHQYLPDRIQHEPDALSPATRAALESMGHRLDDVGRTWGNAQAVTVGRDGRIDAAADPRGVGTASHRGRLGRR